MNSARLEVPRNLVRAHHRKHAILEDSTPATTGLPARSPRGLRQNESRPQAILSNLEMRPFTSNRQVKGEREKPKGKPRACTFPFLAHKTAPSWPHSSTSRAWAACGLFALHLLAFTCPYRNRWRKNASSSEILIRSCFMLSRSRTVTVSIRLESGSLPSSALPKPIVSKSTVMQNGVPTSS